MAVNNGKGCVHDMVLLPLYFFALYFFQNNIEVQFLFKNTKTLICVFIQTVALMDRKVS